MFGIAILFTACGIEERLMHLSLCKCSIFVQSSARINQRKRVQDAAALQTPVRLPTQRTFNGVSTLVPQVLDDPATTLSMTRTLNLQRVLFPAASMCSTQGCQNYLPLATIWKANSAEPCSAKVEAHYRLQLVLALEVSSEPLRRILIRFAMARYDTILIYVLHGLQRRLTSPNSLTHLSIHNQ